MRSFTIWYRNKSDGRAPECVFLDNDYTQAGELEGNSIKELHQKLQAPKDTAPIDDEIVEDREPDLYNQRAFTVGDVVQDAERFYILTPMGIWAEVQAFLD